MGAGDIQARAAGGAWSGPLAAAMLGLRSVCCVDRLLIRLVGQRDTLRLAIGPC